MNYTLAVFRSRFATLSFANLLKANNVPVAIINTPQGLTSSCGISVKFISDYFPKVQSLFGKVNLNAFVGFFAVTTNGGRYQFSRI